MIHVYTTAVTLELATLNNTFAVVITQTNIELGSLATAIDRELMVLSQSRTVNLIIPVSIGGAIIVTEPTTISNFYFTSFNIISCIIVFIL